MSKTNAFTYGKLRISCVRAQQRHRRIEKEFEALRIAYGKRKWPHPINKIVEPLAKEIAKRMPDWDVEVLGPFGLRCEAAIHAYKKGIPEDKRWSDRNCKSIAFTCDTDAIKIRDYSHNTKRFPEGSLGDLNGMNHPDLDIPDDATVEWFIKRMG